VTVTADDAPGNADNDTTSSLTDASVDQLAERVSQLDSWDLASENPAVNPSELDALFARVFPTGYDPDRDWDNYHLVRSEYDRRAAEEFDLGQ
jgi:hypothetical protein